MFNMPFALAMGGMLSASLVYFWFGRRERLRAKQELARARQFYEEGNAALHHATRLELARRPSPRASVGPVSAVN